MKNHVSVWGARGNKYAYILSSFHYEATLFLYQILNMGK